MNNNYSPKNIKSISDIGLYLEKNIESYKVHAQEIVNNSDFTHSQQLDIYSIISEYYYAIADICDSIKLLSK